MPYHFEFDAEHKVMLVVLEGEVNEQEIAGMDDDIRAQAVGLKPLAAITDFSLITAFNVGSGSMREAANKPSPYPAEMPRFIVAPRDHLFGMARMYETFAERPDGKLRVVRSREEALAVLGAQNPRFEKVLRSKSTQRGR